jgi:hypothetical protein
MFSLAKAFMIGFACRLTCDGTMRPGPGFDDPERE